MNGFNIFIFVFLLCWTFKSVSLQVITAPEERDECSGNIVLSSPNHNHIVTIQAASLQQKRRRRRIKRFEDSRILSFEYVDMTGNCLWSVWNKFRNGESFQVDQTGTHEPGWSIKAVKLL